MRHRGARRLLGDVHRFGAVAVAAFQRIIGLEPCPFVQRQFEPVIVEFFAGVDGAEQVAPDFLGSLHLARDLVGPVVRHVAVRASGAYAGSVAVVDRGLEFLEHVVLHFVAGRAESLSLIHI